MADVLQETQLPKEEKNMNRRDLAPVAGAALAVTALLALILTAFTWPVQDLRPRHLPMAVGGPSQEVAVEHVRSALGEEAVVLHEVASRDHAVAAIQDREVYAAVVTGRDGLELLVASAASPAVAQMLTAALGPRSAMVTEVAPLPAEDPRGSVFAAGAFPLVLGGIVTGVALSLVAGSGRLAVGGATTVAGTAGLALTGLLQGWLGALNGDYWANAGVVALGIAAISLTVIGLFRVLGPPGIALGALTFMLLGNPLSGVTSAPELLPLGNLGQLLPPGAAATALRSTAFFDGAGAIAPLSVLIAWAAAGAVLAVTGRRGRPAGPQAPAATASSAGTDT